MKTFEEELFETIGKHQYLGAKIISIKLTNAAADVMIKSGIFTPVGAGTQIAAWAMDRFPVDLQALNLCISETDHDD